MPRKKITLAPQFQVSPVGNDWILLPAGNYSVVVWNDFMVFVWFLSWMIPNDWINWQTYLQPQLRSQRLNDLRLWDREWQGKRKLVTLQIKRKKNPGTEKLPILAWRVKENCGYTENNVQVKTMLKNGSPKLFP